MGNIVEPVNSLDAFAKLFDERSMETLHKTVTAYNAAVAGQDRARLGYYLGFACAMSMMHNFIASLQGTEELKPLDKYLLP